MNKVHAALIGALFSSAFVALTAAAETTCPTANATVPPGANTTDPSAPFFIDTTGMNLSTMPPNSQPIKFELSTRY